MTQTERLRYEYELDTYEIDECDESEYGEILYGTFEDLVDIENKIWG